MLKRVESFTSAPFLLPAAALRRVCRLPYSAVLDEVILSGGSLINIPFAYTSHYCCARRRPRE
jgi:hypothetical protein